MITLLGIFVLAMMFVPGFATAVFAGIAQGFFTVWAKNRAAKIEERRKNGGVGLFGLRRRKADPEPTPAPEPSPSPPSPEPSTPVQPAEPGSPPEQVPVQSERRHPVIDRLRNRRGRSQRF